MKFSEELDLLWYRLKELRYKIKCFFKPYHKEIRAKIPKQWGDISKLIEDVNLQFIVSFYDEAVKSLVDWQFDDSHRKFFAWLEESNKTIKITIPDLEREMELELESASENIQKIPYSEKYGKYDMLEKNLDYIKTKLLKEMIEYRHFFWT